MGSAKIWYEAWWFAVMAYPEDHPPQEVVSNWDNKIYIKTNCQVKNKPAEGTSHGYLVI